MRNFILTSESVTEGHPDKLCDQISDAIVDAFLETAAPCTVQAECAVANGVVFLSVLHGSELTIDLADVTRGIIADVGYVDGRFAATTCTVLTNTNRFVTNAPDLSGAAMTASHSVTAFGYACRQSPDYMPYPIWSAHQVSRQLDQARRDGRIPYLLPDGQIQVAVRIENRQPVAIESVTLTTATRDEASPAGDAALEHAIRTHVIEPAFARATVKPAGGTEIVIRRASPLAAGGPANHAGLTGRKMADDGYGGYARLTASALSGKDPSRSDRIATYAARHLAKCVVAAEMASECEIQLSYGIGRSEPISLELDTFGTGQQSDEKLSARLREIFDMRIGAIVERFDLWALTGRRGGHFFRNLAVYGQIGRGDLEAPWEDVSLAKTL